MYLIIFHKFVEYTKSLICLATAQVNLKFRLFFLIQVREVCQSFSKDVLRWQVYALLALQEVRYLVDMLSLIAVQAN